MAVSHVKSLTIADGTDTNIVRPSDWASAHNQYLTLGGNTLNASTLSGTNIVMAASGGVSLVGSQTSQMIISVAPEATANIYSPPWAYSGRATNSSLGNGTLYFQPFDVGDNISGSRINFYISYSGAMSAVGASTGTCWVNIGYAIYTRGQAGATNSDRMGTLTSYEATILSQSMNSNTQYAATHYIGLSDATSHSTVQTAISNANASTYQVTNLNGGRVIALPLNTILTPGRYWLGFSNRTTAGNAMTNNISVQITSVGVQPEIRIFGQASSATNASVFRALQGWGSYSATSTAWPATIALSTDNIRAAVGQTLVHFDIVGYGTSTNII